MRFTKCELEMIYKYEATTKEDTVKAMRDGQSAARDDLTRIIIRNAADKLEKLPEPECSRFIADNKAYFLGQGRNSVLRRLNEAKERLKQPVLQGHDLSGKERFHPETRHMITLEVQKDCFVGFKGERFRFYLSDEGYRNAKHSEQEGEIRIKSHAAVVAGKLYPDKKPRQQER